jgi:Zn-dependent protease
MVRFTGTELHHLSVSVLALAVAVSGIGFLPIERVGDRLAAISIPLALGFVAHELAHKYVANRYGYFAAYQMWMPGLAFALLIGLASGGNFLFAAPGAVVILSPYFTRRQSGLIGLAGPVTNIAIVGCLLLMSYLPGVVGMIGFLGARINLWLAFFNLLPIPPLDGAKVFSWNPAIWAAIEVPLLVLIAVLF